MTFKKTLDWFVTGILIIVLLATFNLVISTKSNGGQGGTLFGNKLMVVLSGSMSPTFKTGSVVAAKPVRFEEIKKGDIITFREVDGRVVTHRVWDKKGNTLITKGDANKLIDKEPVTSSRVIGRVGFWVPYIGYLIEYVKSKNGVLICVVIPGIILVLTQLWKIFRTLTTANLSEEKSKL